MNDAKCCHSKSQGNFEKQVSVLDVLVGDTGQSSVSTDDWNLHQTVILTPD